jgi:hypothetical protein
MFPVLSFSLLLCLCRLFLLITPVQLHTLDHSFDDKSCCAFLVAFRDQALDFVLNLLAKFVVVRHG